MAYILKKVLKMAEPAGWGDLQDVIVDNNIDENLCDGFWGD